MVAMSTTYTIVPPREEAPVEEVLETLYRPVSSRPPFPGHTRISEPPLRIPKNRKP